MLGHLFAAGVARSSFADHAADVGQRAHRAASQVQTKNEEIEFDIGKLFLITHALWTILQEEHGYTDEKLVQRVAELDLLDGKLDGRLVKNPKRTDCPKCGRKMPARRNTCMYCGTPQAIMPFD